MCFQKVTEARIPKVVHHRLVCGGEARLSGTRVCVWNIIWHLNTLAPGGQPPREEQWHLPHVSTHLSADRFRQCRLAIYTMKFVLCEEGGRLIQKSQGVS